MGFVRENIASLSCVLVALAVVLAVRTPEVRAGESPCVFPPVAIVNLQKQITVQQYQHSIEYTFR